MNPIEEFLAEVEKRNRDYSSEASFEAIEEIRDHLIEKTHELQSQGMDEHQAHLEAIRQFGKLELSSPVNKRQHRFPVTVWVPSVIAFILAVNYSLPQSLPVEYVRGSIAQAWPVWLGIGVVSMIYLGFRDRRLTPIIAGSLLAASIISVPIALSAVEFDNVGAISRDHFYALRRDLPKVGEKLQTLRGTADELSRQTGKTFAPFIGGFSGTQNSTVTIANIGGISYLNLRRCTPEQATRQWQTVSAHESTWIQQSSELAIQLNKKTEWDLFTSGVLLYLNYKGWILVFFPLVPMLFGALLGALYARLKGTQGQGRRRVST